LSARVTAATALAPAIWGTTYVVTAELLPAGRPLTAAAVRALPVGLLLVLSSRRLPVGAWWWRSAVLGMLNFAVFFSLLFAAAYRLPGGVAATVGAIQPLLVIGLAAVVAREPVHARRVVAGVAAIVGVGLLVLDGGAVVDGIGVLAAAAGAMSMATGSVLIQRWGRPVPAATFAGWQLVAGGSVLAPLALAVEGAPRDLTAANIGGYAYLAVIGGGIAYSLWFRGLPVIGASKATFVSLLSPIVATVITLLLGEHLTLWQLTGFGIVVVSIASTQLPRRTPVAAPQVALGAAVS
jgi:probable blue pigment (indigoidine) exporter